MKQQQTKDQSNRKSFSPQLATKAKPQGKRRQALISISCPASGSLSPYSLSCRPKPPGPPTPRPATEAAYLSHLDNNEETTQANGQSQSSSGRSVLRSRKIELRSTCQNLTDTLHVKSHKGFHLVFRRGDGRSRHQFSTFRPSRTVVREREAMTIMELGDSAKENDNASNADNLPSKRIAKKTQAIAAESVHGNSVVRILPARSSRAAKAAPVPAQMVDGEEYTTMMPPPLSCSHSSCNQPS